MVGPMGSLGRLFGRGLGTMALLLVAASLAACGGGDGDGRSDGEIEVLAQADLEGIPADVEAAEDAVWVADTDSDGGLVKLDAESLEQQALLRVREGAEAVGIGETTVWALSRTFGDVIGFDREAADAEGETIDIGAGAPDPVYGEAFEDLAASGDVAYANGSLGLVRVTEDSEVIEQAGPEPADPYGTGSELEFSDTPVAAATDAVWATTEEGLGSFDLETLEPIGDGAEHAAAIAVSGDKVWSLSEFGVITHHPSDGDSEEIADLEERFADEEDPEAIAFAGDVLWVVGAGELLRIDPKTGDEIGDVLQLPDATDESGYAISAGAPGDSVVIMQRPTGIVWRVG